MNKFVKFAGNTVGVVIGETKTGVNVVFHNGKKAVNHVIEKRALTPITSAEFRKAVIKKGNTSMLKFLLTEVLEQISWQTDQDVPPDANRRCLVITKGESGPEGRAVWTGWEWRMNDGFRYKKDFIRAWAYEPKGPQFFD